MKLDMLASFSVNKELGVNEEIELIQNILLDDEEVLLAYTHSRDKVWFTNRKIIALDIQGVLGSKKEYKIFPYSKITSFSVETAGTFDGDGDFKIWVSGVGVFEIKFSNKLDISKVSIHMSKMIS